MNIEVKNSVKPIEYSKSIQVLEKRVKDVFEGKKKELIWKRNKQLNLTTKHTNGIN